MLGLVPVCWAAWSYLVSAECFVCLKLWCCVLSPVVFCVLIKLLGVLCKLLVEGD